ncbi:MAG: addiction module protein [Phycisphaerae bacterium]
MLTLPLPDRVELIRRLTDSLDPSDADPDAEALWDAEIRDRLARYDRGEVDSQDAFEALDEIRQALRGDGGR